MSGATTVHQQGLVAHREVPVQALRSAALVLGLLVACWAVLLRFWGQWLAPDYPSTGLWSMLAAVATWAGLMYHDRDLIQPPSRWLIATCALFLGGYVVTFGPYPRLLSSGFAMTAMALGLLATLAPARRIHATGLILWMLASLPLGVAFNTYFGYPLRIVVGYLASVLLGGGIDLLGAGLSDGTHTVFIDAPCSGVRMLRITALWVGMVTVLTQLRVIPTLLLAALGCLLALIGNTARVCILFILSRRGEVADWLHEGTGVAAFGGTVVLLTAAALWFQRRQGEAKRPGTRVSRGMHWPAWGLAMVGVLAALVPLTAEEQVHEPVGETTWPLRVDGERWRETPPDAAMARFRDTYLGDWTRGTLEESGRTILLRQCSDPTLTLHTTEECYRAFGFRCSTLSAWKDTQGHLWSRFRAEHPDGRVYTVRQCFFSVDPGMIASGGTLSDWTDGVRSWPDAASWYWAAARPASGVARTLAVAIATTE